MRHQFNRSSPQFHRAQLVALALPTAKVFAYKLNDFFHPHATGPNMLSVAYKAALALEKTLEDAVRERARILKTQLISLKNEFARHHEKKHEYSDMFCNADDPEADQDKKELTTDFETTAAALDDCEAEADALGIDITPLATLTL